MKRSFLCQSERITIEGRICKALVADSKALINGKRVCRDCWSNRKWQYNIKKEKGDFKAVSIKMGRSDK